MSTRTARVIYASRWAGLTDEHDDDAWRRSRGPTGKDTARKEEVVTEGKLEKPSQHCCCSRALGL